MYTNMGWGRFLLALGVVSLPLVVLEREDSRWAWRYTGLIVLMLVVTQWRGIAAFSAFVRRELGA